MDDKDYLKLAIEQAKNSVKQGGFPAGAIIVKNGKIIAEGLSLGYLHNDPTSHAETAVIREVCQKLGTSDLIDATLYGSMECCLMCFSAANWANISRIVYACKKTSDMVVKRYYEGSTDLHEVNNKNERKIEVVYIPDLEQEVLENITYWESLQSNK